MSLHKRRKLLSRLIEVQRSSPLDKQAHLSSTSAKPLIVSGQVSRIFIFDLLTPTAKWRYYISMYTQQGCFSPDRY